MTEAVDTIEAGGIEGDVGETSEAIEAQQGQDVIDDASPEFIELGYSETQMVAGTPSLTSCDESEPGVRVCGLEVTGAIIGTHVGQATETQVGTLTFDSNTPCALLDRAEATVTLVDLEGTITSQIGDELNFRLRGRWCGLERRPAYWTVVGGTGRFEGVSGTMSSREHFETGMATSVGTLGVRTDLWGSILPSVEPDSGATE